MTSQPTIRPQIARTTSVSSGLKKNITGRKTKRVSESSTVPNSWPVRKVRTLQISFMSRPMMPTWVRSK